MFEIKDVIESCIKNYSIKINVNAINTNLLALQEMKTKNGTAYLELVNSANNAKITALTIIDMSQKGLIINKDFYLTPYKNKITLTITSRAWSGIILKNNIRPIKDIKKGVIFKGEDFEWDHIYHKPLTHSINMNIDTTNYENIIGAYAFCTFLDDTTEGVVMRKPEIDKIKLMSPSGNSLHSPWNNYPKKMVEAKLYRELSKELNIDYDDDEKVISISKDEKISYDYMKFEEIVPEAKELVPPVPISNVLNETNGYKNNEVVVEDDLSEWNDTLS